MTFKSGDKVRFVVNKSANVFTCRLESMGRKLTIDRITTDWNGKPCYTVLEFPYYYSDNELARWSP